MTVSTESMSLPALDGYPLSATVYRGEGKRKAMVVVGGATGVPQGFYRRFAHDFVERGIDVATVDYRGIGQSRRGSLRGFAMEYTWWAERDLAALVAWAVERAPTAVVGHSYGGHAFGLLPQPNRTLGLYSFATGCGWSGYMPWAERLKVELLWKMVGPVVTSAAGYLPQKVWGGEDLPLAVYRDWRRWCQNPRYWFDDPTRDMASRFARVTVPVVGVNTIDDLWAPPPSAKVFFSHYTSAPVETRTPAPEKAVGHMGYFRAGMRELFWNDVEQFVDGRLATAQ